MSDLGNTTTPVDKPVEHAEKIDEIKNDEGVAAEKSTESKGKGKGKAVDVSADEEDDDDDDDDEDDDEDEEDDEDDLDMDEVNPQDIIPPSSRRSARSGQIDYSSEEALKKAGLASAPAEEEDEEFKGDETMEDD